MVRRSVWCAWMIGAGLLLLWGLPVLAGEPAVVDDTLTVHEVDYFERFILDGGLITWFILIPASIWTGEEVMRGVIEIRRARLVPEDVQAQVRAFFDERQYRDAVEFTAGEPSLLSRVVHAGLSEANGGYAAMQEAMIDAGEERTTRMLRRIESLNLIGNISPMVGLFGTVFGMIKAFNSIVEQGGAPDPSKLADGISTALVTTFWGLLVAIPALFFFSLFRNRITALGEEANSVATELLSAFKPSKASKPTAESKA